jgi:hypothetical protein
VSVRTTGNRPGLQTSKPDHKDANKNQIQFGQAGIFHSGGAKLISGFFYKQTSVTELESRGVTVPQEYIFAYLAVSFTTTTYPQGKENRHK